MFELNVTHWLFVFAVVSGCAGEKRRTSPLLSSPADLAPASSGSEQSVSSSASAQGKSAGASGHTVGACKNLGAVGQWENITPPGFPLGGDFNYGVNQFMPDPQHSGTVYLGTSAHGIYKTTDCGSTWVHINTGKNGENLDIGRQWSLIIDPSNSQIIYANAGYGGCAKSTNFCSDGAFKSVNGGVDWEEIWPKNGPGLEKTIPHFVDLIKMDPADPKHILVSFHAKCIGVSEACFVESKDGGATFKVIWGKPGWSGGEGQVVWFLDSTRWLFGSESNGLWRTPDSGNTWIQAIDGKPIAHSSGSIYRAKNGAFYVGSADGILYSENGDSWKLLPNSGQLVGGIIGDGTTMFASSYAVCFAWGKNLQPYKTSPEADGKKWTPMASPPATQGGWFGFDADHKLLYSSNCQEGFWRVVVP